MMQTHRDIFVKVLIVTIVIGVLFFISFGCIIINDICLALFASAVIATFLEFVNYLSAKRQLIIQLIADNAFISNAIGDSFWLYKNCNDYEKILDDFIGLYNKIHNYICCISREVYFPLFGKDCLEETIADNVNAIANVYDLTLKIQRTIELYRLSRRNFSFESKTSENINQMTDKQLIDIINEHIELLKNGGNILLACNKMYKDKYDLNDTTKVRNHYEVVDEIMREVEKKFNGYK